MAIDSDISGQKDLLQTYRQTLSHYLKQRAQLGSAYTPPGTLNGIIEARTEIRRIKRILSDWGAQVADHPGDEEQEEDVITGETGLLQSTPTTKRNLAYSFNTSQDAYIALRAIVTERTRRLIIWCGSGLSVPAGLPTWANLRTRLQDALTNKANTLDQEAQKQLLSVAESIKKEQNNWIAFQRLKSALGSTTFRATIREALRLSASALIPEIYTKLWQLKIAGILNLNLDRLATRAFLQINQGSIIQEFNSNSVGSFTHVLKSPDPFIYNLHGAEEDFSSWVFTHEDLSTLSENQAYINFVSTVLSAYTVVFVGISADDIAVGGHLERLKNHGVDFGSHYWITNRSDITTDQWAERASIRIIRYRDANNHLELDELFHDLLNYIPPDENSKAPPVYLDKPLPRVELPSTEDLIKLSAEDIRIILNQHATEILKKEDKQSFVEYTRFSEEYDQSIYLAWYTSTIAGRNKLLGYFLEEEVAKGAFGRVYKARNNDGQVFAVKVLHNEIRSQQELLQGFRRGVRSMRILSKRGIQGMVDYKEASEIPAFVVMDWIEGANLKEAVLAKRIDDWYSILKVGVQLSNILKKAHSLPERVLHRDLRPANIMLQDLWTSQDWNVVVLDFDLSWHRGAYEKSVIYGSGTAGYLAPEQVEKIPGVSTQHASVDAFGLGMTLYYIITEKDPVPNQHKHTDWETSVRDATIRKQCKSWRSTPHRFARLILNATRDKQAERWDVTQIYTELQRLLDTVEDPTSVQAADLIAEEIAERSEQMTGYSWEPSKFTAQTSKPTGVSVELSGEESRRLIELHITRSNVGFEERKKVGRWLVNAADTAAAILRAENWMITEAKGDQGNVNIVASLSVSLAQANLDQVARTIDRALKPLSFD